MAQKNFWEDSVAADKAVNAPVAAKAQQAQAQAAAQTANTQTNMQEGQARLPYIAPQAETTLKADQQRMTQDRWKYIDDLSGQYTKTEAFRQYDAVIPALAGALRTGKNSMSDVDLTYAAAKIFDPGSVVRGEEQESFKAAQAKLETKRQEIMKDFGYDNGVFTPESREKLRAALIGRALMLNKSLNRVRLDFKKKAEDRGLPVQDVIGTHPGAPFMADLQAYSDSLKVRDKRKAAALLEDEQGKAVPPAQGLVEPDTPVGPTADEQQRARVGLLEKPPEDMQVAGEMIRAPRFDAQRESDVRLVTGSPNSTPEEAAKAIAQAAIDQGLETEEDREKVYERNLPSMRKWYEDTTPEQRSGAGFSYDEADKKATLNAPVTEKLGQSVANLDESAANIVGGTMSIPKDIALSAINGEPQGIVNAAFHPGDTFDALTRKYRSGDEMQTSLITDPLAIPGDIAGVLSGGGGLLRLGGRLGRGSALGAGASNLGSRLQHLSGYLDPATVAGRTLNYTANPGGRISRAVGRAGAYGIGGMTGVGHAPIDIAADAGWQAGRYGDTAALDAFNLNRTQPGAHAEGTVEMAQNALDNFRNQERTAYRNDTDPFFNATDLDTVDLTGVRQQLDDVRPLRYDQELGLPQADRPSSHREWDRASDALNRQVQIGMTTDPTALNPRNLDAFKKDFRDVVNYDPGDPTFSGSLSRQVPDNISAELRNIYPEYNNIMERYRAFKDNDELMRRTFGLGKTANDSLDIEGVGRRLGSALRPNVNTNYGQRTTVLNQLAAHGAPTLPASLAGQSMSAVLPRGIQGALIGNAGTAGIAGLGAALLTPWSAATLPLSLAMSSPRIAGRVISGGARRLGSSARAMENVIDTVDAPRAVLRGHRPSEVYAAVRPTTDVLDAVDRGGEQVDLDLLEKLRRQYLIPGLELPPEGYAKGGAVVRDTARQMGKGATFAWSDELEAAARAAAQGDPSKYKGIRDGIRAQTENYEEEHPIGSMVAEEVGAMVPSLIARRPIAGIERGAARAVSRIPGAQAASRAHPRIASGAIGSVPEMLMGAVYAAGNAKEMSDIPSALLTEIPAAGLMYGAAEGATHGLQSLWKRYKGR